MLDAPNGIVINYIKRNKRLPNIKDINLPLVSLASSIVSTSKETNEEAIIDNNGGHFANENAIKKPKIWPTEVEHNGQCKRDNKEEYKKEIVDHLGEWSDWIYEDEKYDENDDIEEINSYKFLPQMLRPLARLKCKQKLVKKVPDIDDRRVLKWNTSQHKLQQTHSMRNRDAHVRPCKNSQKKIEITLDSVILKNMTVINQFNREFIAGVTKDDGNKYLVLIDQHAMDERIRYECLLQEYTRNKNTLRSIAIFQAMEISDLPEDIVLSALTNSDVLKRFGLTLCRRNNNVAVSTIPTCLTTKKTFKTLDITNSVRNLIMEIGEKLISKSGTHSLPRVIHNAIASEACHGAIRFGDTLNKNQCKILVSHWLKTDLPNRCAHGRPVVIPLMEINLSTRRHQQLCKEKLNFQKLKKYDLEV